MDRVHAARCGHRTHQGIGGRLIDRDRTGRLGDVHEGTIVADARHARANNTDLIERAGAESLTTRRIDDVAVGAEGQRVGSRHVTVPVLQDDRRRRCAGARILGNIQLVKRVRGLTRSDIESGPVGAAGEYRAIHKRASDTYRRVVRIAIDHHNVGEPAARVGGHKHTTGASFDHVPGARAIQFGADYYLAEVERFKIDEGDGTERVESNEQQAAVDADVDSARLRIKRYPFDDLVGLGRNDHDLFAGRDGYVQTLPGRVHCHVRTEAIQEYLASLRPGSNSAGHSEPQGSRHYYCFFLHSLFCRVVLR